MRRFTPAIRRFALGLAGTTLLTAAAHAAPCTPYAGKQYVFLLQGSVRTADGTADAGLGIVGRLQFDAAGAAGTFSSVRNGGAPVAVLTETGTFTCAGTRPLGGMAQALELSNGLSLLVQRDRTVLQLIGSDPFSALNGEARPAADWATLAGQACDRVLGKTYVGRAYGPSDGLGVAQLNQWTLTALPGVSRTWGHSTGSPAALPVEAPLSQCVPQAADGAALLTVDNGVQGANFAYPAADGTVAWMHGTAGRGVGGWLRPR